MPNDKPKDAQREALIVGGFAHEVRSAVSGANYALEAVLSRKDDALLDSVNNPEMLRDVLLTMRDGLDKAQRVVQQAMEYASLGRMVPTNEHVDVASLLSRLQAEFDSSFSQASIACAVNLPSSVNLPMKQDHAYAILRNLIANARDAIVAQPEHAGGQIMIRAESQSGVVRVTVEDNGPGIPETIKSSIFEPFFTTKGSKGTGVGLGFCRQIAALYGGEITFAPRAPAGTTFTVTIKESV